MSSENWDEIRTAFQVAKSGTVSGAAQVLGVHHATVIRHIDALEDQLGVKLFQRHPRGYTPTEAGHDLLTVAQATDDQFAQLVNRIKGRGDAVSGELVVTSLEGMGVFLVPVLKEFQTLYPDVIIRYLTGERVFRLEYGEAHVALRAGRPPQEPDNVVQPLFDMSLALYAKRELVEGMTLPLSKSDLQKLTYVSYDTLHSRVPFNAWFEDNIPAAARSFRSTDADAIYHAIREGAGAGFLPVWRGDADDSLVQIIASDPAWSASHWLVTHVDLHRTPKVQAFLRLLKERAKEWKM